MFSVFGRNFCLSSPSSDPRRKNNWMGILLHNGEIYTKLFCWCKQGSLQWQIIVKILFRFCLLSCRDICVQTILIIWWKEFISFKYWPMNISARTSQCPNSPTNLFCLSNAECNRCKRTSGAHEQCSVYSSTPVCDVDSTVSGIQDTGDRKLAECVQCKKDGMLRLT